jgi:hypothetical protein
MNIMMELAQSMTTMKMEVKTPVKVTYWRFFPFGEINQKIVG